jgi:hypothetical protein
LATNSIVSVEYDKIILPKHIKMPLVFQFNENVNFLKISKKDELKKGKKKLKNEQKQQEQ